MSAQLKHSGDSAATDNKPSDRRRGAAGRAAALRRAPSDSDCSGETASLSADSGERRPPPPPPRSGKTRSRRRGSEWEVLEGLKDGQRFERRPEVFNGFLHKKRKWPLKGWHKRFFVVDGGILVYARSPTDVARGRLHGSLDVGLSVISAKPRRRRIDIDADEFIYHLRAKTPDVFRTWLNVLKAHRLYRQHLLTFGARESVPKIHAPMEDLPPTDTSSRISQSSLESFSSLTRSHSFNPKSSFRFPSSEIKSSDYNDKSQCALGQWKDAQSSSLIPFESSNFSNLKVQEQHRHTSLCSTHCIEKRRDNYHDSYKALPDVPLYDEQQMLSTDLDLNTLQGYSLASDSISESKLNNINIKTFTSSKRSTLKAAQRMHDNSTTCNDANGNSPVWLDNKEHAVFCFSRKHRHRSRRRGEEWAMRRSRKCTNLVKCRNISEEPRLTKPLLRQMILCKYRLNVGTRNLEDACVYCDLTDKNKADKSTQDAITISEYDKISERLIFNLFDNPDDNNVQSVKASKSSVYINQVVKELYDLKMAESKKHPIKFLFKSLLQYFLKNTEGRFKGSIQKDIAVSKPSNTHFTKDKATGCACSSIRKESQESSTPDTQRVEQFIKSNVYFSSIGRSSSLETDIKITKTLIDNLDISSTTCVPKDTTNVTDSSELPKLQEYIKHLMSETSLSKAVAKDFLNAYLDVLSDGNKSITSSESSPSSRESTIDDPMCDIQTECVRKKISKCVTANNIKSSFKVNFENNSTSEGRLNLKEMLENMIGLFTNKVDTVHEHDVTDNNSVNDNSPVKIKISEGVKSKLETLVSEILEDNTMVIDLTKYDVENVLMSKDTTVVGATFLTIDLKDKSNSNEAKLRRLSLKFNNDSSTTTEATNAINTVSNKTNPIYQVRMKSRNPFLGKNSKTPYDEVNLEKHSTSHKPTSKANYSDQSFNKYLNRDRCSKKIPCQNNRDSTQCYHLSSIQEDVPTDKKKIKRLNDFISGNISAQTWSHKNTPPEVVGLDFFFRVLKKLVVLSKDIPSINKEINSLYLKLKTTRENATKSLSRVSLLGNIYGININQKPWDRETPIYTSLFPEFRHNIGKKAVEIAINTSFIYPKLQNGMDKALSAIIIDQVLANISVQTLSIDDADRSKTIDKLPKIYTSNEIKERQELDVKDEWFKKLTREYVETAAIKCMLKKYQHLPQSIRVAHPIKAKIPDIAAPPNSSVLATEISSFSPPLTVSSRSQNRSELRELFKMTKCKLSRSESMTDSSVYNTKSEMSDDLKTLYRCSSDPSYCSGWF